MTWKEFRDKVDDLVAEAHLEDVPLGWIDWDIDEFGGPTPCVYVGIDPTNGKVVISGD